MRQRVCEVKIPSSVSSELLVVKNQSRFTVSDARSQRMDWIQRQTPQIRACSRKSTRERSICTIQRTLSRNAARYMMSGRRRDNGVMLDHRCSSLKDGGLDSKADICDLESFFSDAVATGPAWQLELPSAELGADCSFQPSSHSPKKTLRSPPMDTDRLLSSWNSRIIPKFPGIPRIP
jgi:hypothetical protein